MNNLNTLNDYLFLMLDNLTNEDLTDEQLAKEIRRAEAITRVGDSLLKSGALALETMKHMNEYGYAGAEKGHTSALLAPVPEVLQNGK